MWGEKWNRYQPKWLKGCGTSQDQGTEHLLRWSRNWHQPRWLLATPAQVIACYTSPGETELQKVFFVHADAVFSVTWLINFHKKCGVCMCAVCIVTNQLSDARWYNHSEKFNQSSWNQLYNIVRHLLHNIITKCLLGNLIHMYHTLLRNKFLCHKHPLCVKNADFITITTRILTITSL